MRPGRIDRKIEYKLATAQQASALFNRFYPVKHVTPESLLSSSEEKSVTEEEKVAVLERLNREFTAGVPEHEFSTAELQGYLLSCKMMPEKAAKGVRAWVAEERRQKEEKQKRIEAKKKKQADKMERMEVEKFQSTLAKINGSGVQGPGMVRVNGTEKEMEPLATVAKPLNGSALVAPTVSKQLNGVSGIVAVNGGSAKAKVNGVHDTKETIVQDA